MATKPDQDLGLEAVIFDCDGVLVDTEPLHYRAFEQVLLPFGLQHDYACYLDRFIGFDDRDAFIYAFKEAGKEISAQTLENLIEAKSKALRELVRRGVSSFPGVIELIRELARHEIPMGVASGALRHEVAAFVSSLGLDKIFRTIVAAEDVKKSKPDPETYLLAVERLRNVRSSLDSRNCIAIEDTPAGIHSAKSAGLMVIAVTNSFAGSELEEADKVVDSMSELSFDEMVNLRQRLSGVPK